MDSQVRVSRSGSALLPRQRAPRRRRSRALAQLGTGFAMLQASLQVGDKPLQPLTLSELETPSGAPAPRIASA